MQFRVVIIEALPNEIMQSRDGFEKLTSLLAEEAKSGWSLKQVDSAWAQGYMIYTVVLQKPEPGDELPTPPSQIATVASPVVEPTEPRTKTNSTPDELELNHPSPEILATAPVLAIPEATVGLLGPRTASWLIATICLGLGTLLLFLGLLNSISGSELILGGQTPFAGLFIPGLEFTLGLILIIFASYKLGEFTWRVRRTSSTLGEV